MFTSLATPRLHFPAVHPKKFFKIQTESFSGEKKFRLTMLQEWMFSALLHRWLTLANAFLLLDITDCPPILEKKTLKKTWFSLVSSALSIRHAKRSGALFELAKKQESKL